jgi:hypothetical protein
VSVNSAGTPGLHLVERPVVDALEQHARRRRVGSELDDGRDLSRVLRLDVVELLQLALSCWYFA